MWIEMILRNKKVVIWLILILAIAGTLIYSFIKISSQKAELKLRGEKIKSLTDQRDSMLVDLKESSDHLVKCKKSLSDRESDYKKITSMYEQKERNIQKIQSAYEKTIANRKKIDCKCKEGKNGEVIIEEIYHCPDMQEFQHERNIRVNEFNVGKSGR